MAQQMTQIPFHSELSHNGITLKPKPVAYREEAQSLIELALMVPLFILLTLGSAELAHFAWASVLTANAARAGAQYGAQNPTTSVDGPGIKAHAASDSVNITGLITTPTLTCACSNGNAIPSADCTVDALSYCASPNTILDYVHVNTTSTVKPIMQYPGLPASFTATGQSIMVVEQ